MKKSLLNTLFMGAVYLAFANSAHALPVVSSGTIACTGVQMNSLNKTHYRMVNFNGDASISITRFQVFDSNGVLKLDYPAGAPFPADFKTTLTPHQIGVWRSESAFGDTMLGPLQVIIDFSSDAKAQALHALTTRLVDDSATGEEVTRSDEGCKYIKLTK